jgi:peptidoglycan/LPS O-acetylase OafA/YrhL
MSFANKITSFDNKIQLTISSLSQYREEYMGLAITLVVLYHLYAWCNYGFFDMFHYGYVGVDIFMFLSGYGCCFSYNKYSSSVFYKRRFIRIYPLFFIFYGILFLSKYIIYGLFSSKELFTAITTIDFYNINSTSKEWYISSMVLLYALFPLLYRFTNKKIIICSSFIALGVTLLDIDWRHDCLVSRIPLFLLGIWAYKNKGREMFLIMTVFILIGAFSFLKCQSPFMMSSMFCPLLLYFLSKSVSRNYILSLLGKYTLDIFLANGLVAYYLSSLFCDSRIWIRICVYVVLNILLSIVFIFINRCFKKILNIR